jgi:hypothetical protein
VQTQHRTEKNSLEQAGYFNVAGAHIYTVLHAVPDPLVRVLLVGPFASERHNTYVAWVRWARYLAARRIEVLRFDYRGVGESTGVFEDMTFEDWSEDVQLLADWMKRRSPGAPLLLNGLELGAILAGRCFHGGTGDALLLWSPPATANHALRATLLRWVALEQLLKYSEERKTGSAYIRQIEQGSALEVEGYEWPARLWRESFDFTMPAAMPSETCAVRAGKKPIKVVKLGKDAAPLAKKGFVEYDEVKDLSWLYSENLDWIMVAVAMSRGDTNE